MKVGKVSESVLKRSVLKQIKSKRNEVLNGTGVGEDCAILAFSEGEKSAVSTSCIVLEHGRTIRHAMLKAVNNLAAGGAKPVAVTLALVFPEKVEEAEIKQLMQQADNACRELDIQIAGGHTTVSASVQNTVATVTAIGNTKHVPQASKASNVKQTKAVANGENTDLDIVVTKWIGLEGTVLVAKEKEADLLTKYPTHLVEEAKSFEKYLSVLPEAFAVAPVSMQNASSDRAHDMVAMHDASEGGIFGALWELGEKLGTGLAIDLKKLPLKQETVEVCEFFDLNPYELLSMGSLVIATPDGEALVRSLEDAQIPAVIVGRTTASNDRVVINDGEKRFLEPRKTDEIYKMNFS